MNVAFRKRHRTIWLILGVLLPILFILSLLYLPNIGTQDDLHLQPNDYKTESK